jgi:three-Cys-motif partner protein
MNQFGGNWTQQKIEIVASYAKAYLTVMKDRPYFKLLYFDGFAGSGDIFKEEEYDYEIIEGTAMRILEIDNPRPFDMYYFVEKDETNKKQLEENINKRFPSKKPHVVCEDCNKKLIDLADFLKKNNNYKVLAFIDPYGMSVNWASLEALKGLGVDLWILVPTGMGVNRLLKNDGKISNAWLEKLEKFMGMNSENILKYFYKEKTELTLFGEQTIIQKEKDTIDIAAKLYKSRLNEVFEFVSEPFVMKNSTNSIMYHFMMATNNKTAIKIANDVIKPKYK